MGLVEMREIKKNRFEDKIKELDILVLEAEKKKSIATRELNEINSWIRALRDKQKEMIKKHQEAERHLQGFSIQTLHRELEEIIRLKIMNGSFFDYYGSQDIDLEKLISEKLFFNELINIAGGKRIHDFYHFTFISKEAPTKSKIASKTKTFMKKFTHPLMLKVVSPYLLDREKAKPTYNYKNLG